MKKKGILLTVLILLAMVLTIIPQMTAFAYADEKVEKHDPYEHAKACRITQEFGPHTLYIQCEWEKTIPIFEDKRVCQFCDWPLIVMSRPDCYYDGKPKEPYFSVRHWKNPMQKEDLGFPYDYAEWDGKFIYTGVNGTVEYGPTTDAPIGEGTYYVYATVKIPSAKTIFNDGTFILGRTYTIDSSEYDVYFDPNVPDSASTKDKLQGAMDKEHFKSSVEKQPLYPNQFRLPGYTFAGWNTKPEGNGKQYADNAIVGDLSFSYDVTLYAQWTPKPYNVTLKPGFEGGEENNLTANFDQPVKLPTAEELGLEYPNHTFLGWKASDSDLIIPGGTSIVNLCGALDNYFNDPNDAELEAQWVGNGQIIAVVNKDDEPMEDLAFDSFNLIADNGTIFTVPANYDDGRYIFDPSNAEHVGEAPAALPPGNYSLFLAGVLDKGYNPVMVGIKYGEDSAVCAAFNYYTVSLEADPAYKDLHQVRMVGVDPDADGRYTTVILAGDRLSLQTSVNDGYHFDGYSATGVAPLWDGDDRMNAYQSIGVKGKAEIMAHVAANNYKVKFDANTKTPVIGEMEDQDMIYDEPQNLFANQFTRGGAVFTGWNTKADGSGAAYSDEQSVKNLTAENGGSVTLYAQWKETPVETALLTFDLDGGTLDDKTDSFTVRENKGNIIKMPAAPVREGYTFRYWEGSEYNPGDEYVVANDHTFTALWEKNPEPEPTPPEPTPPEPTPPEPTPPEPTPEPEPEPTPAHEHVWGEGKVTRKASLTHDGKITYTCTVCGETKVKRFAKVKISKPKKMTFAKDPKHIVVKWTRVKGADSYILSYRKVGGKWKTKTTSARKIKLGGMENGKLYQFRVAAVRNETETTEKVTGKYCKPSCRFYRGIKGVSAAAGKKSIKITWNKVKGASGYMVLIADKKDMNGSRVIRIRGKKYTSRTIRNNLKSGETYYVSVRAYKAKSGKMYKGIRHTAIKVQL